MKYDIKFTTQFKRDLKLAKKQHKDISTLIDVIEQLANGETLDIKYRDHDLSGNSIEASAKIGAGFGLRSKQFLFRIRAHPRGAL